MDIGDTVGATWREAWRGKVLDIRDPVAWKDTVFGEFFPLTRESVAAHIAEWPPGAAYVPVQWDFGGAGHRVYWERRDSLYVVPESRRPGTEG